MRLTGTSGAGIYNEYIDFSEIDVGRMKEGKEGLSLAGVQHLTRTSQVDFPSTPAGGAVTYHEVALGRIERTAMPDPYSSTSGDILWHKTVYHDANALGAITSERDHYPDNEDEEAVALWRNRLFTKDEGSNRLWIYHKSDNAAATARLSLLFDRVTVNRETLIAGSPVV